MFKRKKKKDEDKVKPLKHVTVYFDEGNHIKYEKPVDCTINENIGVLNIKLDNQSVVHNQSIIQNIQHDQSIVYNLRHILAYEFEEEEGS